MPQSAMLTLVYKHPPFMYSHPNRSLMLLAHGRRVRCEKREEEKKVHGGSYVACQIEQTILYVAPLPTVAA